MNKDIRTSTQKGQNSPHPYRMERRMTMTDTDLQQFGGDITPMEMYDALCGIRAVMTREEVPEVPNAMQTLNCLIQVVKQEFDLEEQLKDRYNRSKQCQNL